MIQKTQKIKTDTIKKNGQPRTMIRRIFSPRGNDFLVQDGYLHLQRKVSEIEVEGELSLDSAS